MSALGILEDLDGHGYKIRAAIARRAAAGARARLKELAVPVLNKPQVSERISKRRTGNPIFSRPLFAESHASGEWPAYTPPVLYDYCDGEAPRKTIRRICEEVAEKHGLTVVELRSARRSKYVVRARHEAFWRCRQETTASLPQIGRHLGGKDHTTVLHGIRMHEKRMREAADGQPVS